MINGCENSYNVFKNNENTFSSLAFELLLFNFTICYYHHLFVVKSIRYKLQETSIVMNCRWVTSHTSRLFTIGKKPTHIGGSLLDHVYVKINILEEFPVYASLSNMNFSDHDAIRANYAKKKKNIFT